MVFKRGTKALPISAISLVANAASVVDAADRIAHSALDRLECHPHVQIDLSGVKGVSSAFFNHVLREVASVWGRKELRERVRFISAPESLAALIERSYGAIEADESLPDAKA